MADWSDLIGMTWDSAAAKAKRFGFVLREECRDGVYGMVTADYRTDRIGVVTETYEGELRIASVSGVG